LGAAAHRGLGGASAGRGIQSVISGFVDLGAEYADPVLRAELLALRADPDAVRARDRLWEILDDDEAWPGFRRVGRDGAESAWWIAQAAIDDLELQRRCLEMLEISVACGDADPAHLACLLDRVRMADGRGQLYGSQFVLGPDGTLVPWPIDDVEHLDVRRARFGMEPFAEHAARMLDRWAEAGGQPGAGASTSAARQQYHAATER